MLPLMPPRPNELSLVPGTERFDYAVKAWGEGKKSRVIADEIGVPKGSLCRAAHKYRSYFPARIASRGQGKPYRPKREPRKRKPKVTNVIKMPVALKLAVKPTFVAPVVIPLPKQTPFRKVGTCLYPIGDGRKIRFECSTAAEPGYPYCYDHCDICYLNFGRRLRVG